jgi:hypothetical protein
MEARRLALLADDPAEKADLLEVEQGWLSLARSHEPWSEDNPEDDQGEKVRGRRSTSGRARSR